MVARVIPPGAPPGRRATLPARPDPCGASGARHPVRNSAHEPHVLESLRRRTDALLAHPEADLKYACDFIPQGWPRAARDAVAKLRGRAHAAGRSRGRPARRNGRRRGGAVARGGGVTFPYRVWVFDHDPLGSPNGPPPIARAPRLPPRMAPTPGPHARPARPERHARRLRCLRRVVPRRRCRQPSRAARS